MKNKVLFSLLAIALFHSGCRKEGVEQGLWRGAIYTQGQEIPFQFLVETQGTDLLRFTLVNGEERLAIDSVSMENDSVEIPMLVFDAYIKAKIENDRMSGRWIKPYAQDYRLPFRAEAGMEDRFIKPDPAGFDVSGKWEVFFYEEGDSTKAVGSFEQKANQVQGSFALNTGDYRFLEGVVSGDSLFLSTFDGTNAYLFKAAVNKKEELSGEFYSGKSGRQLWTARRNDAAALEDPGALAQMKPGYETVDFTFPSLDSIPVSLSDERFANKVVIVQVMGSWCANCMDESKFLAEWYRNNRDKPVEIVALAFERKNDFDYAKRLLSRYVDRFDIQYPILFAGSNSREDVAKALPGLDRLAAFPTTIFLDRDRKVRKIHTGFSGPATGELYNEFVEEFNAFVNELAGDTHPLPLRGGE